MATTVASTILNGTRAINETNNNKPELTTINIACLVFVILLNLACNASAIFFILKKQTQRTLKDKIVVCLCTLNATQSVGFSIELHAAVQGETSPGACETAAFIIVSLTYSSIGYFVCLAIERCVAITYPFKYVVWFGEGRKSKWLLLILPPVFGVALGVPPLFGWASYGKARDLSTYCGFDFDDNGIVAKSYFITVVFLIFVLPITATAVCFIRILMDLKKTAIETKRKYGRNSNISRDSTNTVKEQSISCLLTGMVYIGSWIPYAIICFAFYYNGYASIEFELVAIYLSKSSTISSPIVYCLIERRFRAFVKERIPSSVQLHPMLT